MLQKKKQTRSLFFRFFSNAKQSHAGFSLAEMILVVALTLFLLTVTVQGFVNSASQFSFANVSQKIEEMIRTARSLAISGKAQIDYTDFDKDDCKDKANHGPKCADTAQDDYVTPAHYGVNFAQTAAGYSITLFADNHSSTNEGKYNHTGDALADYQAGGDIVLEKYDIPSGMDLIIPQTADGSTLPGDGTSATIFFSPVFADVSSDVTLLSSDPFFRFGLSQKFGNILRKRCSQVHIFAGISEPMSVNPASGIKTCP